MEIYEKIGSSGKIRAYNPSVNSRTRRRSHARLCAQVQINKYPDPFSGRLRSHGIRAK